ncbi:RNA-directed DNA polymerase, eukaryota, reverse transcriptase zinc-binding domain protein [Tanacetum coccineum]|uniref:RNA-directed DNA polymerase, eukaryota, reverse transcriptase zinc-binding domain protein n=1 Tax=Tanacetum coccineum TaxID=301880 RepID=A0ABQ5B9Z6_9ASTR
MKDEELILYQKAKVKWLSVGDRNNAYFHKTIKSRQQRNRVDAVCDENGKIFEGKEVDEQFVKHFQKFLGESKDVEKISNMGSLLHNKLNYEEATWSTIRKDVCLAVKELFENGRILKEINSTLIALVPKIHTPQKVFDFRPIACCNVIYKCISKVITERIKGCLDKLVSRNQSAFIPNRHIQDNILLAQELFKGYDRKTGPKRVALKVDIQKSCGYFKGERGLRQGDPMSPYLFTLVMEILTLIIKRKVESNHGFQYHFGCKKLKITNVCFADDLLMSCHADSISVSVLKESIDEFCKVAGLIPNYNKSTIISGCLNDGEQQEILEVMPFNVEKLPIRYLGVPLTSRRIKHKECKCLIDKVESRVQNWKNKSLSYAGRLMLAASVLESIHVYWAFVFLLRDGVIKDINQILKDFLWNQTDGTKGRPKVTWKNVCRFKQKGGLGLKDLGVWNIAMIIKHLWHIVTDKESLWVKWINTEKLKGRSFWDIEEDKNDKEWILDFPTLLDLQAVTLEEQNKDSTMWRKKRWNYASSQLTKLIETLYMLQMMLIDTRKDSDSHSHLFFEFEYSKVFWGKALEKMEVFGRTYKWNDLVVEMSRRYNGNSINSIIRRLCFTTSVYLIMQERNNRIFRDESRSTEEMIKVLIDIVRMRLLSLKFKIFVAVIKAQERIGNVVRMEEPFKYCE